MEREVVVEVSDVSFSYGNTPVLDKVNVTIYRDQSVCILGPNGGGKTTLLRLLLGQLEPDRGQIRILGQSPAAARTRIGYMPQRIDFDRLFPVSVLDVVLMGRLGRPGVMGMLGWYDRNDRRAAHDALALVHLEEFAHRPFVALSGGQRQRTLIARALCCDPEILMLDEPTANVDSLVEAKLFDVLRELGKRMTVILVSHDLGFVTNLVESVVCVNRNAVVHPTSLVTADLIKEMYGGDMSVVRHGDVLCHREHVHE